MTIQSEEGGLKTQDLWSSRRVAQNCRYQLRIHILCNLFEIAVMQANHETISVVIWLACFSGIVPARFHYNVVAFSNKPMANGFYPAINPRPQLTQPARQVPSVYPRTSPTICCCRLRSSRNHLPYSPLADVSCPGQAHQKYSA